MEDQATRLVLFAHGSRDPAWCRTVEDHLARCRDVHGDDRVRLAYMQFVSPAFEDVVAEAVRDGVERLEILPLFLSSGGHVDTDVPEIVGAASRRWPGIRIEIHEPVGEDPRFAELVVTRTGEILG